MPRASAAAPVLASDRIQLDPLTEAVADEMVGVLSDPRLYEFIGGSPPALPALRERYRRQAHGVSPDGCDLWFNWVIRDRKSGCAVGLVQSTLALRTRVADLAWIVGVPFQRQGYASEAAAIALDWLESRPEVRRVTAHIGPHNAASQAVAHRLGFCPTARVEHGETVWEHSQPESPK